MFYHQNQKMIKDTLHSDGSLPRAQRHSSHFSPVPSQGLTVHPDVRPYSRDGAFERPGHQLRHCLVHRLLSLTETGTSE